MTKPGNCDLVSRNDWALISAICIVLDANYASGNRDGSATLLMIYAYLTRQLSSAGFAWFMSQNLSG